MYFFSLALTYIKIWLIIIWLIQLSKHLGPFRLWKLSLTFCSLIFTIDIAKKRQPKALEWNSEFGWQVLEAKKYHTILLPCYLKMVHLHIHLYKKCIWTIFISIQRIEYHIYIHTNILESLFCFNLYTYLLNMTRFDNQISN